MSSTRTIRARGCGDLCSQLWLLPYITAIHSTLSLFATGNEPAFLNAAAEIFYHLTQTFRRFLPWRRHKNLIPGEVRLFNICRKPLPRKQNICRLIVFLNLKSIISKKYNICINIPIINNLQYILSNSCFLYIMPDCWKHPIFYKSSKHIFTQKCYSDIKIIADFKAPWCIYICRIKLVIVTFIYHVRLIQALWAGRQPVKTNK